MTENILINCKLTSGENAQKSELNLSKRRDEVEEPPREEKLLQQPLETDPLPRTAPSRNPRALGFVTVSTETPPITQGQTGGSQPSPLAHLKGSVQRSFPGAGCSGTACAGSPCPEPRCASSCSLSPRPHPAQRRSWDQPPAPCPSLRTQIIQQALWDATQGQCPTAPLPSLAPSCPVPARGTGFALEALRCEIHQGLSPACRHRGAGSCFPATPALGKSREPQSSGAE